MTKTAIKEGQKVKSQSEARELSEKLEVTGRISDGILTIEIPLNVYKNDRNNTIVGSSFGKFVKVAGAVREDKDIILNFNAVQSNR
jgi:hypothetical protein